MVLCMSIYEEYYNVKCGTLQGSKPGARTSIGSPKDRKIGNTCSIEGKIRTLQTSSQKVLFATCNCRVRHITVT